MTYERKVRGEEFRPLAMASLWNSKITNQVERILNSFRRMECILLAGRKGILNLGQCRTDGKCYRANLIPQNLRLATSFGGLG